MVSKSSLTSAIISQVESHDGIRAGIVRLEDVLESPSYKAAKSGLRYAEKMDDISSENRASETQTVLLLGLNHPKNNPRLDYWERGDSLGNRHLRGISELMKQWLRETYGLTALPLSYHMEKGGLFLKDAAVLSGLGIIGYNNLLIHPEWGPRIRLHAMLLEGDLQTTRPLKAFAPCETCEVFCQKACPMKAFPKGEYNRSTCQKQMNIDVENISFDGEIGETGNAIWQSNIAALANCPVR